MSDSLQGFEDNEGEILKLYIEITHALAHRVAGALNCEVGIFTDEVNVLRRIKAIIKEEEDSDEKEMRQMEQEWAVVIWEYGYHCDEFDIIKVRGPLTFEEAEKVEAEVEATAEYYTKIAPIRR